MKFKELKGKISEAFVFKGDLERVSMDYCDILGDVIHGRKSERLCSTFYLKRPESERIEIVICAAQDIVNAYFEDGEKKQAFDLIDHLKRDIPYVAWRFDDPRVDRVSKTPIANAIRR